MAAPQLNEQLRKRLAELLADDRPDSEQLLERLIELRRDSAVSACATALHRLAHLELPEGQAERLLRDLLAHRDKLTRVLRRDPGLRVATIDYLSNVKKLLANPTIVETSELEKTERSAITDGLTGLYNRRYFMSSLGLEVRRSRRYGLRLALLMLDLDEFKRLNDDHGHLFGDLVLKRVGRSIRRSVREADLACRFGGEEFAVILPETDRLGGYAVAGRIRNGLRQGFAKQPVGGSFIEVGISGGIAAYPDDATEAEGLVARADQALYLSKSRGKDCISLYHSERRQTIRYPAKSGASLGVGFGDGSPARRAAVVNLSRGGALIALGDPCREAARCELAFGWRDAVHEGRVVRVERAARGGYHVGIAFDRPLDEECLVKHVRRSEVPRTAAGRRA